MSLIQLELDKVFSLIEKKEKKKITIKTNRAFGTDLTNNSEKDLKLAKKRKLKIKKFEKETVNETLKEENQLLNDQLVPYLINDIYLFLKIKENSVPIIDIQKIQSTQKEITNKMRSVLVDWLIEIHQKYNLKPSTLYLSIVILDKYLEKISVPRRKFQLCGIVSLLIASKYEEIFPPHLKDLNYICNNVYNTNEIHEMESDILNTLDFNLSFTTRIQFFKIFCNSEMLGEKYYIFANYLLELTLMDLSISKFPESIIAMSTLCFVYKIKSKREDKINFFINDRKENKKVKECLENIFLLLKSSKNTDLTAIQRKYESAKYLNVANIIWKE